MKPETLAALRASITHWENNATQGKFEGVYGSKCALCTRFEFSEFSDDGADPHNSCTRLDGEKCPIYIATGKDECDDSPWAAAADSHIPGPAGTRQNDYFLDAAKVMAEFLKSLLPKEAGQ